MLVLLHLPDSSKLTCALRVEIVGAYIFPLDLASVALFTAAEESECQS